MQKQSFYYDLPPELIAQQPIYPRDSSRMLCYCRQNNELQDKIFHDLPSFLQKGDVLVVNNTRVINARVFGYDGSGKRFEIFLLKRIDLTRWECLLKPAKKAKIGTVIVASKELSFKILDIIDNGVRIVECIYEGVFEDILSRVGEVPLPPYIVEKLQDKERYQTVYSQIEGSSAAPTAGLHFTESLLNELQNMGVIIVNVLLHVGLGTFRPVKVDNIEEHNMHSEYYEISADAANAINSAVKEKRRVIAVGTTSVRVLESVASKDGYVHAGKGYTNIFIYPGYEFLVVKGLITNFHLPESTLIMLVSAFIGREKTLQIYNYAVANRYRFFSFGDALLLL